MTCPIERKSVTKGDDEKILKNQQLAFKQREQCQGFKVRLILAILILPLNSKAIKIQFLLILYHHFTTL